MSYEVFTNSCGSVFTDDFTQAILAANNLDFPEWDRPIIFETLKNPCPSGCECSGLMHKQTLIREWD